MKKIVDYKILCSELFYDLEKEVKEHMKSGWQPQGGIAFYPTKYAAGSSRDFMQAIIKYED